MMLVPRGNCRSKGRFDALKSRAPKVLLKKALHYLRSKAAGGDGLKATKWAFLALRAASVKSSFCQDSTTSGLSSQALNPGRTNCHLLPSADYESTPYGKVETWPCLQVWDVGFGIHGLRLGVKSLISGLGFI